MATFNFNRNNLIAGTTYSALTSSATSLLVSFNTDTTSGNATASSSSDTLPDTPFFATLSPSGVIPNLLNSEIVLVTAKTWVSASSTWQFTIVRARRGTTARAFDAGSVFLGGVYTEDIDYTQAVGKGFFTASYNMGLFDISDDMLPTTPTNGMSIKVIFSQDVTSGTLGLSLNSGTVYNVYSGAAITSGAGSTTSTPLVKSGIIYDLVFYNGAWYVMNVPTIDSTYPIGSIYMSATLSTPASVAEALGGGTWVSWGSGRVPVGVDSADTSFNTVEKTGGNKTHTHNLSDNGWALIILKGSGEIHYREKRVTDWTDNYKVDADGSTGEDSSASQGYGAVLRGATDSASGLQPYITCYMYKRTA